MCQVDQWHIAVNGPNNSLDILSSHDLSLIVNLNTDGKIPSCVARSGNLLFAGCNQGYLFQWNIDHGFQSRIETRVHERISQIIIFKAQQAVGAYASEPDTYMLLA